MLKSTNYVLTMSIVVTYVKIDERKFGVKFPSE